MAKMHKFVIWIQTSCNFIVHVKTDDVYKDIPENVETRSDTSNFQLDRSLPNGKNKKVIELMKDELGGPIMKEFSRLRAKTYSCLKEDNGKDKKAKYKKECVIKKLKFQDYKISLEAALIENQLKYLEKIKLMQTVLKKIKKNS